MAARPAVPRPKRRRLLGVVSVFVVLAALYTAYWVYARGQILTSIDAWTAEQRTAGYVIEHGGIGVGGYPLSFALRMNAPRIEAPALAGGWRVALDGVRARAMPYDFTTWTLDFRGPATYRGGETAARTLTLNAREARVRLSSGNRGAARIGLDIRDFEAGSQDGAAPLVRTAERIRITARQDDADVLRASLSFVSVTFVQGGDGARYMEGFGPLMSEMSAQFTLHNWSTLAREGDPAEWGRAGGRLEMANVVLEWGAINLTGAGDISLDPLLQPRGRVSLTVINPEALADALVEGGFVTGDSERALRLAVQIAPRTDNGVSIPLVLRDGGVFLGPIRVGHIGSLAD